MKGIVIAIKILLAKKGLRQKDLAQKMGWTEKKLSNALTGRKVIDDSTIRSFCEALEVTPNDLFEYKDQ